MSALQDLHHVLRSDFTAFAQWSFYRLNPRTPFHDNWHIELIASELTGLRPGGQLIINVPPRSLKSLLGSVAYVAFLLGHNPSMQIICVSYAAPGAARTSSSSMTRSSRTMRCRTWCEKE